MSSTSSSTDGASFRATSWLLVAASLAAFWASALVARHELLTSSLGVGLGRLLTYVVYLLLALGSLWVLIAGGHITRRDAGLRAAASDLRPAATYIAIVVVGIVAWLGGWVLWGASLGPEQLAFARGVMRQFVVVRLADGIGSSAAAVWTTVVLAGVVGAFAEEVFYRSVLLTAFAARFGNTFGIVVSTVVFVAAHVWIYGYAYDGWPWSPFLLSALLGFVFVRHRSLLVVTSVHVAWNMTVTVTAALLAQG